MVLFVLLAAAFCAISFWRYTIFRSDVDLGIFSQIIAGTGRGFSTTAEGGVNHLLVHWSPIIVTAWPFLRACGPLGLQFFQAILVAAVLFPIWAFARTRFRPAQALALTLIAALYPMLWAQAVGDFHEMAFVPLLSATFVYALDRRSWTMSLVSAFLLLLTKEDQTIALALNGAFFALTARGDFRAKRTGWTICIMAAVVFAFYFGAIRPSLSPHVPYLSFRFFDWTATHHVGSAVWPEILARARYLAFVLLPLACLPCISRWGLFLIPGLVEIFASRDPIMLAPGAHYGALLTGYALVGFVDGAFRLRARRAALLVGLLAVAAATTIWISIFASPMEYWYYLYRRPNGHDAQLESTLRQLPPNADVGAEDEIFAHLGLDPHASVTFEGQQWFVYDRTHFSERWHANDGPAVRKALARGQYRVIRDRDGIVVIKRL